LVAYQVAWNAAHPGLAAERAAAWNAAHPGRRAVATATWNAANSDKKAERCRARRALRVNAPGRGVTARQWAEILEAHPFCHYCGDCTVELVQEHMTPLARGGAHDVSNVTPACQPCNSRKGTKTADEFADRHNLPEFA